MSRIFSGYRSAVLMQTVYSIKYEVLFMDNNLLLMDNK